MTHRYVDLTENPDIGELAAVLRQSSTVTEPAELTYAFGRWLSRRFVRDYFVSVSKRGLVDGQYKITRTIKGNPADFNKRTQPRDTPRANPWRDWDDLPTRTGGIIGEILARGEPALLTDLDLASDPVLGPEMGEDAARMHSMAAMPTFDRGEPINWAMSFSTRADWISLDGFAAGFLDINMLGSATRNLVALREVDTLATRLRRQLEQVASLQRALLPERTPRIPGVKLATSYLTSAEAGGDYYDFFDFGDGRWGLLIADVAGHGAAAATVMAMLRAILHAYEGEERTPAAIMRFCNQKLAAAPLDGSFTTAFCAMLDTGSGELTFARCGHNPPRLRRADGSIESLECAGALPLGIDAAIEIEQASVAMRPGDTLVLYTDGITEAFAPGERGQRDMFGVERLDDAIRPPVESPAALMDEILASLYAHTKSLVREDDQTLVIARFDGADA
ncbi:MAG: PP2C family protein-serine/threonine phosphatase [Phycisphaerales bacterium]